jgi:hypothetical protein
MKVRAILSCARRIGRYWTPLAVLSYTSRPTAELEPVFASASPASNAQRRAQPAPGRGVMNSRIKRKVSRPCESRRNSCATPSSGRKRRDTRRAKKWVSSSAIAFSLLSLPFEAAFRAPLRLSFATVQVGLQAQRL